MDFQNKEQIITNYLADIDFINDNWSYKQIKRDLKDKLGEEPAIDILYKKDVKLNEINSEAEEIKVIDEVKIVFSPELDQKFKTLTFKIGA